MLRMKFFVDFLRVFFFFFFLRFPSLSLSISLFFFSSPSHSSVTAVHLITTVYTTVVRTRECECVREAGEVTAALTD